MVEYQTNQVQLQPSDPAWSQVLKHFFVRKFQFNFDTECQTESSVVCSYIFLQQPPPSPHYLFWPDEAKMSWPSHVSLNFYQATTNTDSEHWNYFRNVFNLFSCSESMTLLTQLLMQLKIIYDININYINSSPDDI